MRIFKNRQGAESTDRKACYGEQRCQVKRTHSARDFLARVRKGLDLYRTHGFWAVVRAVSVRAQIGYQASRIHSLFSYLVTRAIGLTGGGRRILYVDHLSPKNSNLYWLRAFRRSGRTEFFDIGRENRESLERRIVRFKPKHIHLGGSVKNNTASPLLLSGVKKELDCAITVFYGDAAFPPYLLELADVADRIYISNKTHIRLAEGKGFHNFVYMPCPTDPDVFRHQRCDKVYDVIFIGNNNQPTRLPVIRELARRFDLKVFGNGWNNTGLDHGDAAYGKDFSKTCGSAKICLSIIDPRWEQLEGYFSNRLINTLATGSFCIQRYTPGLERVFINGKHLVWYSTKEELFELVEYYLYNEEEREWIATEGQKEVYRHYTYEKSVDRILSAASATRPITTLDEDWRNALARAGVRNDERFTMEWYRNHPITKELLKSDVLQGQVLDVGCGVGTRAFLAQERSCAHVTGIDAARYAIDLANSNFKCPNVGFVCGDLLRIPFQNDSFDNAYMLAVIEHIVDTRTLLSEINRVVKPGGKLFLSVTERDYHSDPSHVHAFTRGSLEHVLRAFGILGIYVHEHIIFATMEIPKTR